MFLSDCLYFIPKFMYLCENTYFKMYILHKDISFLVISQLFIKIFQNIIYFYAVASISYMYLCVLFTQTKKWNRKNILTNTPAPQ